MAAATSRDDEIRLIWTENQWLYLVAGFLGGILFCLLIQLSINNLPELIINLLPEAAGIFITVTVIDVLNRRRDKRNAIKQLKDQLVREAGSNVNDVAKNAVHQMRKQGWLEGADGLLAGTNLMRANLQGADLIGANLARAILIGANLEGAMLMHTNLNQSNFKAANLQAADLFAAHLQAANLGGANLQNSNLSFADLQEADLAFTLFKEATLVGVNLERVKLLNAYLQGANLQVMSMDDADFGQDENSAEFDETTILPDGTYWTPETDMTRFTNPKAEDKA